MEMGVGRVFLKRGYGCGKNGGGGVVVRDRANVVLVVGGGRGRGRHQGSIRIMSD